MEFTTTDLIHFIPLTSQRRVGHTTIQQTGIKNYERPFVFVCKTFDRGKRETAGNKYANYISPKNVDTVSQFINRDIPIVFAHDVMSDILKMIASLYQKSLNLEHDNNN